MDWFNGICDQPYNTRAPHFHRFNSGDASRGYNSTHTEDAALDHAISLSLSEKYHGKSKGYNKDADLARAMQEGASLHLASQDADLARALQESASLYSAARQCGCSRAIQAIRRPSVCGGCKRNIGSERHVSYLGALWHPHCFHCHGCKRLIADQDFSTWGNQPYHKVCYRQLSLPKCDVCKNYVPANSAGLIEYQAHPFWQQKYCPKHETDGIPRCCSCERLESKDVQYVSLDDGRKLCLECLSSSIMDTGECQPLYQEIREFYEGLNMKISQPIPMLLVERQALNEAKQGEKGQHNMTETRGLCLSEEHIVSTIIKRPRIGPGNQMVDMRKGSTSLRRYCEVTAILALYGLPRLLTGSVLAHELMHAWLRLNGFHNLETMVEEGICQVLAHMWLESEVMAGSGGSRSNGSMKSKAPKSTMDKKLGEFFLQQIAKDTSPIYGKGFRAGHASMMKFGLRPTLDHIRMTGSFPI
ncbi:hypothetical protein GOP47_0016741 [Adiantum capillus-veneris]|uniref:LIM zinc-binding domain-containing protein n=1 Tax=Adiantum capillus-veneris TaxID=13818 RepID=A0A9D4ZD96_ADICA|nr:hypothetical protein GOP47_0016741 [Adiantum capillus-veneris]